jgi:putative hydrolase of the HAD superfamily
MIIKAILFDVNGTLIDINTDEGNEEISRGLSHILTYQGIAIHRWDLRDEYFRIMEEQRRISLEKYPEFNVVGVFRELLSHRITRAGAIPAEKLAWLPQFLAEAYRGLSRNRLQLYPGVLEVLDELRSRYQLAAVSDAQSVWCLPEMRAVGLVGYFDPIVVSGDYGYRKPDPRLFTAALTALRASPEEVLFVGNDMFRDVYGAGQAGMKTVFFSSNQGRKQAEGVKPDFIIYQFPELRQAIEFLERQAPGPSTLSTK